MTKREAGVPRTPTPVVEDPHPGSISDGTHPEAAERKTPRPDPDTKPSSSDGHNTHRASTLGDRADDHVGAGKTRVNDEAPRHPTRSANAS